MNQIENVVTDKGSKYAVTGAIVSSRSDVDALLKKLKSKKKYAKATHNTWAVVLKSDEMNAPTKNDDGESGAGALMLKILEQRGVYNHLIVVTRWYGGVHLGADRFRHVRTCVNTYIDTFC